MRTIRFYTYSIFIFTLLLQSCNFNDDFIIAKQKPKLLQDPLFDKDYKYNRGGNEFYYWLIVKNEKLVLCLLNLDEFNILKDKYKVSVKLLLR